MIQRIQTLWLLLSAIGFGLNMLPNIFLLKTKTVGTDLLSDQLLQVTESNLSLIGTILATAMVLIAIFLYKRRPLQLILSNLASIVFILLALGSAIWYCQQQGKVGEIEPGIGIISGFLAIIMIWLASKAIKKDEKLVKSMDRLR